MSDSDKTFGTEEKSTTLQFMNIKELIFTNDQGEIIFTVRDSVGTLESFFKKFDTLKIGSLVFRREPTAVERAFAEITMLALRDPKE